MTLHQKLPPDTIEGVAIAASPRGLQAIEGAGCAAAIWQREPLESFLKWVEALPAKDLPKARIILRPHDVRHAMADLVESYGLVDCAEREMLVDDVAALAQIFATLMDAPYLRLRLDVISTNACRKFHVDTLTARLICTYRGTGTQYGHASEDGDPVEIHTTSTGSPMIMRGALWPTEASPEVLHRSPPIEGTGETRLVLVLDPIVDLEKAQQEQFLH
ncbi:MAG: DUF1826 domain-containing protein [Pseudomonadota bacterium]